MIRRACPLLLHSGIRLGSAANGTTPGLMSGSECAQAKVVECSARFVSKLAVIQTPDGAHSGLEVAVLILQELVQCHLNFE